MRYLVANQQPITRLIAFSKNDPTEVRSMFRLFSASPYEGEIPRGILKESSRKDIERNYTCPHQAPLFFGGHAGWDSCSLNGLYEIDTNAKVVRYLGRGSATSMSDMRAHFRALADQYGYEFIISDLNS